MPETLPKLELNPSGEDTTSPIKMIDESQVSALLHEEFLMLDSLKKLIGKKLYFLLEEKLQTERQELEQLSGIGRDNQQELSKYTFILDTQYFEQQLFTDSQVIITDTLIDTDYADSDYLDVVF